MLFDQLMLDYHRITFEAAVPARFGLLRDEGASLKVSIDGNTGTDQIHIVEVLYIVVQASMKQNAT